MKGRNQIIEGGKKNRDEEQEEDSHPENKRKQIEIYGRAVTENQMQR